jgi:hypothetical protein
MLSSLVFSRRGLAATALVIALAACSGAGPEKADALDQILQRLRQNITVGEQRIDNLAYHAGKNLGDGRYEVTVDYDLVALAPTMGLFNTVNSRGSSQHVEAERYVFAKSSTGWVLE